MSNCNCCPRTPYCNSPLFPPSGEIISQSNQTAAPAPCFLRVEISGFKPIPKYDIDVYEVDDCSNLDGITAYLSMYETNAHNYLDAMLSPPDTRYIKWQGAFENNGFDVTYPYRSHRQAPYPTLNYGVPFSLRLNQSVNSSVSGNITNISTTYTSDMIGRPTITLDDTIDLSVSDYITLKSSHGNYWVYRIRNIDGNDLELDVIRGDLEIDDTEISARTLNITTDYVVYPLRYQWQLDAEDAIGFQSSQDTVYSDYFSQIDYNVSGSITLNSMNPIHCAPSGAILTIETVSPTDIVDLSAGYTATNLDIPTLGGTNAIQLYRFCGDDGQYDNLYYVFSPFPIYYAVPHISFFEATITGVSGTPCCSGINDTVRLVSNAPRGILTGDLFGSTSESYPTPYANVSDVVDVNGNTQVYNHFGRFNNNFYGGVNPICSPSFSLADNAICGRDCYGNNRCDYNINNIVSDEENYPCVNGLSISTSNYLNQTLTYTVGIGTANSIFQNNTLYASGSKTIPIDSGLSCLNANSNYTATVPLSNVRNVGCDFSNAEVTIVPHFSTIPETNPELLVCGDNFIRQPKRPTMLQLDILSDGGDNEGDVSPLGCQFSEAVKDINGSSFVLDWNEDECRYEYFGDIFASTEAGQLIISELENNNFVGARWVNERIITAGLNPQSIAIIYIEADIEDVNGNILNVGGSNNGGGYSPNIFLVLRLQTNIYHTIDGQIVSEGLFDIPRLIPGANPLGSCVSLGSNCLIDFDNFESAILTSTGQFTTGVNPAFCNNLPTWEITATVSPL